ncbi:unnamed protein product [Rotaria magnacalcarata]|uniref:Uncharacterized protein n=1 Tax=Rotaria magnacalcarata TaxID=392030 RepID=A0A816NCX1_9BILA|nr:unnamed protein product [Rotaria magnacalcarata]CAF4146905.1 unnamed protein product [Rotaria magnacalcarata]
MSFLDKDIQNLQSNFTQILTSDCHYTTSEIINHIKLINNALDNIKLDYEFQRASKSLAKQFNSDEMKFNETNLKELVTKGSELAQQLNIKLHSVALKKKEHNQIREIHNWACDSLLEYLQSLSPHASGSYSRLDNIAHHLGVTDRYVGYRNNLTRYVKQPIDIHKIWTDRKLPETTTPDWKDWAYSFQHNGSSPNLHQQSSIDKQQFSEPIGTPLPADTGPFNTRKPIKSRSFIYASDYNTHLIKAGINLNYPGGTETAHRFAKLKELSRSPSLAVAQADYTSLGRPLSYLISEPAPTEYSKSYTFPDSSKIERYPYLRP